MVLRGLELLGGSKNISILVKMIPHTYTYIYIYNVFVYALLMNHVVWCIIFRYLRPFFHYVIKTISTAYPPFVSKFSTIGAECYILEKTPRGIWIEDLRLQARAVENLLQNSCFIISMYLGKLHRPHCDVTSKKWSGLGETSQFSQHDSPH